MALKNRRVSQVRQTKQFKTRQIRLKKLYFDRPSKCGGVLASSKVAEYETAHKGQANLENIAY